MTLTLLLALVAPVHAGAANRTVAPPGASEADQYFQTLPASTGPRAPNSTKKARDAVRDGALTDATEGALRQRGPRGLAVATAVAKTAPARGPVGGGSRARAPAVPVGAIGEPGLGALFPLVLLATAAAALAFALGRRRSRTVVR
jgi:hypothetical protein